MLITLEMLRVRTCGSSAGSGEKDFQPVLQWTGCLEAEANERASAPLNHQLSCCPSWFLICSEMNIMTSQRFAGLLGAAYLLIGCLGVLSYVFPAGLLHHVIHLTVGIWGVNAATNALDAVRFARKVAVLSGILALVGVIPGVQEPFDYLLLFGNGLLVLHGVTAVVAAYYGYYWTDAVVNVRGDDRRAA